MNFDDFGFYTIDIDYVKELYQIDSEVFYDEKNYDTKPYIGIIVGIGDYKYFIPLTSAKPKHSKWRSVSKDYYIIYDKVKLKSVRKGWIYTNEPNNAEYVRQILGVIDIKKMIPVPDGMYQKVLFDDLENMPYRDLCRKEYKFLKPLRNDILSKAEKIYNTQKISGKVFPFYCNYSLLEQICDKYKSKLPIL